MLRKQHVTTKKTLSSRAILTAIVSFLVLFLVLSSVVGLWKKYRSIRAHIKELKEQELALSEKKALVTSTNEYLGTPEGEEEVFRDSYRLVRPGEGIVIITKDGQEEPPPAKGPAILQFWNSIIRGLGLR
ncbi:MAG: hypothetical protein AAB681_03520 [Patescibacteria group bacterium]